MSDDNLFLENQPRCRAVCPYWTMTAPQRGSTSPSPILENRQRTLGFTIALLRRRLRRSNRIVGDRPQRPRAMQAKTPCAKIRRRTNGLLFGQRMASPSLSPRMVSRWH